MYGIANDSDIVTDNAGNTVFAMNTVRIEQFGGEVIKEHHEDNVWVSNVKLQEGLLETGTGTVGERCICGDQQRSYHE